MYTVFLDYTMNFSDIGHYNASGTTGTGKWLIVVFVSAWTIIMQYFYGCLQVVALLVQLQHFLVPVPLSSLAMFSLHITLELSTSTRWNPLPVSCPWLGPIWFLRPLYVSAPLITPFTSFEGHFQTSKYFSTISPRLFAVHDTTSYDIRFIG